MNSYFNFVAQSIDFKNFLDALNLGIRLIDYVHVALKTIQLNFLLEDGQFA
jgi:hypothetical protein